MKKIVFISGLHRSGTSILHRTLGFSNNISGFNNTGAPEDEGQHLQSVFKTAKEHGGPGKFAFDINARLDENSDLITPENKKKLLNEWSIHWDNEKPIWIEKSPPNIIRTRFFQELFPEAYFITIMRHPLAVSLATQKWSKTSTENLINHWITAHNIYLKDRVHLKKEILFAYEDLVQSPEVLISKLEAFLDTEIPYTEKIINANEKYFREWNKTKLWQFSEIKKKRECIKKYEKSVNSFGYSLTDFEKYPKLNFI